MDIPEDRVAVPHGAIAGDIFVWLMAAGRGASGPVSKVARGHATDADRRAVASYLAEKMKVSGWEITRRRIAHPHDGHWLE